MNGALYNEIEPFACDWLENLIRAGHIAPGRVERRSIADLKPADVAGPGQRHFFAGIGGWSLALRLAGVPDDANVWTGSCPCQPFSDAGKRSGTRDARHLWPTLFELIRECRPAAFFGEQVASRAGLAWFDVVRRDLERCGYAVGASDLCAASVGAPHIRQRLYFVAYADEARRRELGIGRLCGVSDAPRGSNADRCGEVHAACPCEGDYCTNPDCDWPDEHNGRMRTTGRIPGPDDLCDCGHRAEYHNGRRDECCQCSCTYLVADVHANGQQTTPSARKNGTGRRVTRRSSCVDWRNVVWLPCLDGKARPVEPGLEPLAHGVSKGLVAVRSDETEHHYNRAGTLAGFGNAIVPQVAAAFIRASEAARKEVK